MAESGEMNLSTSQQTDKMPDKEPEFVKVKTKSRKRKLQSEDGTQESAMDTSEVAPKRPNLPPISADKLTVCLLPNWPCLFV